MQAITNPTPWISSMARVGLISKGIVYLVLGALAFMAAFEIGGHSSDETSKTGLFDFIKDSAGMWLLILLSAGLFCYSLWRGIQAFSGKGKEKPSKAKRARYFFSGLAYLALAISAVQVILHRNKSNGDQNQYWAGELLSQPFGQILTAVAAMIMTAIGIYQIWYGLSAKYKKHVKETSIRSEAASLLIHSGTIGYVARGVVWLILAYLLFRAALHSNASEAGNTAKAFQFIESGSMGSYLLGALGIGLIAYGFFNFIRARFEKF